MNGSSETMSDRTGIIRDLISYRLCATEDDHILRLVSRGLYTKRHLDTTNRIEYALVREDTSIPHADDTSDSPFHDIGSILRTYFHDRMTLIGVHGMRETQTNASPKPHRYTDACVDSTPQSSTGDTDRFDRHMRNTCIHNL